MTVYARCRLHVANYRHIDLMIGDIRQLIRLLPDVAVVARLTVGRHVVISVQEARTFLAGLQKLNLSKVGGGSYPRDPNGSVFRKVHALVTELTEYLSSELEGVR